MSAVWLASALVFAAILVLTARGGDDRARLVTAAPGRGSPALQRATAARLGARLARQVGIGPASRRRRAHERLRVVQALGALAAELQAGQPPLAALDSAGGVPCVWPRALAAVRLGEDVSAALAADAAEHAILRQLAACWQVAAQSGSGLAPAVSQLAGSARTAEDVRVHLEGQLAGPRATARMLAVLPFVGLGFGIMLGANPVGWLTSTPFGWACLVSGLGLAALGTWWTGRIAAAVERML